ncbi:hypothetical protein GW17_00010918 [Ensete ventricosum]|nr:hypothetical protein GW17_00010918 [Ensete ventricosum]
MSFPKDLEFPMGTCCCCFCLSLSHDHFGCACVWQQRWTMAQDHFGGSPRKRELREMLCGTPNESRWPGYRFPKHDREPKPKAWAYVYNLRGVSLPMTLTI